MTRFPAAARLAPLLIALCAGCYSSAIPPVPCSATAGCPTGQSCDLTTGACSPAVTDCTPTQVLCGGTCNETSACLQCVSGHCIALGESSQSLFASAQDNLVADGVAAATLTVTVKDRYGNLKGSATVSASASGSANVLSPASGPTNASGVFTFKLASTVAEAKSVTVSVTDGTSTFTKSVGVTFIAGSPAAARSKLVADVASITASSGGASANLKVTLADQFGNVCPNVPVAFTAGAGGVLQSASGTSDSKGTVLDQVHATKAGPLTIGAAVGAGATPLFALALAAPLSVLPAPPDAGLSSLSADRDSVLANGSALVTYTATLKDAFGNGVPLYTAAVSVTGAGTLLSATSTTSDITGAATFALASTAVGAKVVNLHVPLTPPSPGFDLQVTSTFIAGAPVAANSTFTVGNSTPVADGFATASLSTTLLDANRNPVAGYLVTYTVAGSGNTLAPTGPVTTNASGSALATVVSTVAEAKQITAAVSLAGAAVFTLPAQTVTFVPGDPSGTASTLGVQQDNATADGSHFVQATLVVRDAKGNAISNLGSIGFTLSGTGGAFTAPVNTDANGRMVFNLSSTKAETKTLTATIPRKTLGTPVSISKTLTFVPGAPAAAQSSFAVTGGRPVADGTSANTLTTTVLDAQQNPVPGLTILYAMVQPAQGALTPSSVTTDASGVGIASLTSTVAELKQVTAQVIQGSTPLFSLGPVSTTFVPGDADSTASVLSTKALSPLVADNVAQVQVTLIAKDAKGNLLRNLAGVTIAGTGSSNTFSPAATNNVVTGTTDANGAFVVTLATKTAEAKTITATLPKLTAGGTANPSSVTVNFVAGPAFAANTTLTTPAVPVTADGVTTALLTLTAQDQFKNPLPALPQIVSASYGAKDTLGNTWTNLGGGVFTITVVSTGANASDKIAFGVSGSTQFPVGASVNFVAGPPSAPPVSVFTASPASASTDASGSIALSATFVDRFGNPVSGKSVTFSATGTTNSFSPAATGTTDANGTVAATMTSTKAETKTVTVALGTFQMTTPVTFVAGQPSVVTFTAAPTASAPVYADGQQTYTLSVSAADQYGNPCAGNAVSLTTTGTQTVFTPPSGALASAGAAVGTFTATAASTVAQTEAVTVTVGGVSKPVTLTFTPTPWQPANQGFFGGSFASIAVDPTNGSRVYVGSVEGLWKTSNAGTSSTQVTSRGYSSGLAIDSTGVVYLGIGAYDGKPLLSKSTDQGTTWTAATTGPVNDQVSVLKIDPLTSSTLYAGAYALWQSTDAGANWTQLTTGTQFSQISDIAFDGVSGHVYISAYTGGAFYSSDGGATFTSINGNLPSGVGGRVFTIDKATTPPTLYYAPSTNPGGLYSSADAGKTWTSAGLGGYIYTFALDPSTHQTWFVGGYSGYSAKYTNSGLTSAATYTPLFSNSVNATAFDPTNPSIVWQVSGGGFQSGLGVYRSANSGSTWTTPVGGLTELPARFVNLVAGSASSTLYTDSLGCTVSTNGGASWVQAATGLFTGYAMPSMAADQFNASLVVEVYPYGYGLYFTANGGASWAQIPPANVPTNAPAFIVADPTKSGQFYLTDTSGGLWVMNYTAAAGWTNLKMPNAPQVQPVALAVSKTDGKTLYLVNANGVYKTTAAGTASASFTLVTNVGTGSTITIDPTNASKVYLGLSNTGVLASTDAGSTWNTLSNGLPINSGGQISWLVVDPVNPSTLYASTYNAVYRYGAGKWSAASVGLPVTGNYYQLAISPSSPSTLWIGTGRGVYKTTTGAQ